MLFLISILIFMLFSAGVRYIITQISASKMGMDLSLVIVGAGPTVFTFKKIEVKLLPVMIDFFYYRDGGSYAIALNKRREVAAHFVFGTLTLAPLVLLGANAADTKIILDLWIDEITAIHQIFFDICQLLARSSVEMNFSADAFTSKLNDVYDYHSKGLQQLSLLNSVTYCLVMSGAISLVTVSMNLFPFYNSLISKEIYKRAERARGKLASEKFQRLHSAFDFFAITLIVLHIFCL